MKYIMFTKCQHVGEFTYYHTVDKLLTKPPCQIFHNLSIPLSTGASLSLMVGKFITTVNPQGLDIGTLDAYVRISGLNLCQHRHPAFRHWYW